MRRQAVVAESVHSLGILDEGAAAEAAAELVEKQGGRLVVVALELAVGVVEGDAVLARRAQVEALHPFEEGRGAVPLLLAVEFHGLGVDFIGLSLLEQGRDTGATAEGDRDEYGGKEM